MITGQPLVSVIIPTYNSAAFLAETVASVLAQDYEPLEILVVDDGSTDDTRDVLRPYASRIRYLYQDNRGLSAARNLGIEHATGDLLALLDADDRWLPGKLSAQVTALDALPRAGLVHTDVLVWDPARGSRERPRRPRRHEFVGGCYARLFWGSGILPSSVMLRRASLDVVGRFDEAIRRPSVQGYDLWWRLAHKFEFAYVDTPLVLYRRHAGNASRNILMMREDELFIIRKRLQADPDLRALIGSRDVRQRLFRLWCDIGYLRLEIGDGPGARRAFGGALHQRPTSPYLWMLWVSLLLPSRPAGALRRAKQRLAGR